VIKAHALVPLRRLDTAKTRLGDLLQAGERAALASAMASDVLGALAAHRHITGVTLVSDDPQAGALAAALGATHLHESRLAASGLNGVLRAAVATLPPGSASHGLVLHADLPLLRESDISAVLAALQSNELVIGTDRCGEGTNVLAFPLARPPAMQFGEHSCTRHAAWARAAGLNVEILHRAGIGLDIDSPLDLVELLQREHIGPNTRAWLDRSSLSTRLHLPAPPSWPAVRDKSLAGVQLERAEALALADVTDTGALMGAAAQLRDRGHGNTVTYSRKVFVPLTKLCRDVCHYCTFAQTPGGLEQVFMPVDEVLELCRRGAEQGCQEALFTLGEKPELRYPAARRALADMGYATTLEYLRDVAARVLEETGLLPHINAGCMDAAEIASLREVSASMGIMLDSASERLCESGMPHYGSPDKKTAARLATMERAGQAGVPFTSGILIGIGETRRERVESLLALRELHLRHGHLQEIIVQNFRAKPGTRMAQAPEPDLEELLWTIAVARLVFGASMSIQAPPNLSPGVLERLLAAGINDWGGVSPVTPDHVNPEAPWPHLDALASETAAAGKFLEQRLTIYPAFARRPQRWLASALQGPVLRHSDARGFARRDHWVPGEGRDIPRLDLELLTRPPATVQTNPSLRDIVARCMAGEAVGEAEVERLFNARGADFALVVSAADRLRRQVAGDQVSYVVNRNINYTNVCYFRCQFCAFSKGKQSENLRGRPYDISGEEIARRCVEAWQRGATEVCMQGGIHPDYTGQTYLDILRTVREAAPGLHIHAFSPLEVWQGAQTLGIDVEAFLAQLKAAGLGTLPGTAAEILDDDVRALLCPDKLNSEQWLEVMEAAHAVGLRSTATIMYGHLESPRHWARHLVRVRELQRRSGGFTEFVPLPFVHMEAPMFLKGRSRRGPTFREAVLMHAVARLVFHGLIDNIQASWVKMGEAGIAACLGAGANDLGGTLMNESITRAAGSSHGQEWSPRHIEALLARMGRQPRMRTTLYADAPGERRRAALEALPLAGVFNQGADKLQRSKLIAALELPVMARVTLRDTWDQQVFLMAACD
jgi:FO synthase